MQQETLKKFYVVGISVRTTNENSQAGIDLQALWNNFLQNEVASNIPNKVEDWVYCVYTDYEKDHTKPYTAVLGCKVESLESIPEGMIGICIEEAKYSKFTAKGNILEGMVFQEWVKIWNSDLARTYLADFEVYGQNSQNLEDAEVEIFISIK
jgi:predicted transcriptional regulator YdeE